MTKGMCDAIEAMTKNQKFGVEVEMTGLTRETVARIVAEHFNTTYSRASYNVYQTREINDNEGRIWKVMRDSSISPERNDGTRFTDLDEYKVEMVTPPLRYEDIETLQEIIREIKAAGGKVNSSCGIHIHVDGANHNMESLRRLVNLFVKRQDLIYEALNIGSRAYQWCLKMKPELFNEMKKNKVNTRYEFESIWYSNKNDTPYGAYESGIDHSHYNRTRYHGINLHAFFTKGTVEFRLFNSTLHAGRIKAYIQFCLAVSAYCIETEDNNMWFKEIKNYTPEQKIKNMNHMLEERLRLKGSEFKTCRYFLVWQLKKNAGMNVRENIA